MIITQCIHVAAKDILSFCSMAYSMLYILYVCAASSVSSSLLVNSLSLPCLMQDK